jgi:hypothetical protein
MAFRTYSLPAKTVLVHVKHSLRHEQWESNLQTLKAYLQRVAPRYKIYSVY